MATLTKISNAQIFDGFTVISGTDDGTFSAFVVEVIAKTFPETPRPILTEEEYPVLAAIWNNEEDAVYDRM